MYVCERETASLHAAMFMTHCASKRESERERKTERKRETQKKKERERGKQQESETALLYVHDALWRGGGLGSRPKKMYGERLGDGVEYHLMSPTPRR